MNRNIIILHGWGLSGSRFTPLKVVLEKKRHTVWTPDFPGFGSANAPQRPYYLNDYALFLHEYIKKHEIQSPGLIGHSFGGRVALKYDSLFPKSTSWIVLSGTPGFRPSTSFRVGIAIGMAKLGKFFVSFPLIRNFRNTIAQNYYAFIGSREYTRAEGTMKETFKQIIAEPLLPYMKSFSVPCLLVWGEEDKMVPIRVAEKMKEIIPGARLSTVKGIGHSLPYEDPRLFVDQIEKRHFI